MPKTTALRITPVVALAASTLVLNACEDKKPAEPAPAPPIPVIAAPAMPTAAPVLDRALMLDALDRAASAYAAGQEAPDKALIGRRFAVRQAFGCEGETPAAPSETPGDGLGHWSWSEDRKSIQMSLAPGDWVKSALISGGSEGWEATEGFWLDRPWLRSIACPGVVTDPLASGPAAASQQVAGIAAVFEADGSRLGRRNGRNYAFTVRGDGDAAPAAPTGGYRLVLEGRLTAFDNGSAIRCRAASPRQRPVCIAAAVVDRVAFEDADGVVLSEWRTS